MTTESSLEMPDARVIFADAWTLYDDALEMLGQDRIRNAAEKAWGATRRAADALILARTGAVPEPTAITGRKLSELSGQSEDIAALRPHYSDRIHYLHGLCFYNGMCEPSDQVERMIRETAGFIRETERLAGV